MAMVNYKLGLTSTGKASVEMEVKEVSGNESDEELQRLYVRLDELMLSLSEKALTNYGKLNHSL